MVDLKDLLKYATMIHDTGASHEHSITFEYDTEYKSVVIYVFDISKFDINGEIQLAETRRIEKCTDEDIKWLTEWKNKINAEQAKSE